MSSAICWRAYRVGVAVLRRPPHVRRRRFRLLGGHVVAADLREDEILRCHRGPVEATEHRELAGVRHRVGQGSLQELLIADMRAVSALLAKSALSAASVS